MSLNRSGRLFDRARKILVAGVGLSLFDRVGLILFKGVTWILFDRARRSLFNEAMRRLFNPFGCTVVEMFGKSGWSLFLRKRRFLLRRVPNILVAGGAEKLRG